MSHAARRKPCQSFECTDVLDEVVITPKMIECSIKTSKLRLGLGRPKQEAGLEEIPCLGRDGERSLEMVQRVLKFADQKLALPQQVTANRPINVTSGLLGGRQAGVK